MILSNSILTITINAIRSEILALQGEYTRCLDARDTMGTAKFHLNRISNEIEYLFADLKILKDVSFPETILDMPVYIKELFAVEAPIFTEVGQLPPPPEAFIFFESWGIKDFGKGAFDTPEVVFEAPKMEYMDF